MAKFQLLDRPILEEFLDMKAGYVYNFSDRSFAQFVAQSSGKDITDQIKYGSGSKASRLRQFWEREPDEIVGKLILDLTEYVKFKSGGMMTPRKWDQLEQCIKIGNRLKPSESLPHVDLTGIKEHSENDPDIFILYTQIKSSIESNQEVAALDRLHTFMMKFIRGLLKKHNITFTESEPLHGVYGRYVKFLNDKRVLDSKMTKSILKAAGKYFEDFNDVRNNNSLAHDSKLLNQDEAKCITAHVITSIDFIRSIEVKLNKTMLNYEKVGMLTKNGEEYLIQWNPIDGLVWYTNVNDPLQSRNNIGQVKPVKKVDAMRIAEIMLDSLNPY